MLPHLNLTKFVNTLQLPSIMNTIIQLKRCTEIANTAYKLQLTKLMTLSIPTLLKRYVKECIIECAFCSLK